MGFAKLDSGITRSSIWSESLATRILWVTMLAEKDENGYVEASRGGLIRLANISPAEFDASIKILESPDPDSKTPDNDGRRVAKIDGGWVVLNSEKYRLPEDVKRERTKERVRKFREKGVGEALQSVTVTHPSVTVTGGCVTGALPSVSVSVSASVSESESKEGMQGEEKRSRVFVPPTVADVEAYCSERKNGINPQEFIDHYSSSNWHRGKTKISDWKACVRTWEAGRANGTAPKKSFGPKSVSKETLHNNLFSLELK